MRHGYYTVPDSIEDDMYYYAQIKHIVFPMKQHYF